MEPDTVATEPAGRRPAVLESAAGGELLRVDELLTEEERDGADGLDRQAACDGRRPPDRPGSQGHPVG
jgi:hypothetical protein